MNSKRTLPMRRVSGRASSAESITDILKLSAISVAISLSGALVLSFFASLIAFKTKDPLGAATPISTALICLASLSSGFIGMKLCKRAPLTAGLISGTMMTLFILTGALFLRGEVSPALSTGTRVFMHVLPIPLSSLGSFAGNIKPAKKRRRTGTRR